MKKRSYLLAALLSVAPFVTVGAAEVIFAGNRDGQFDLYRTDLKTSQIQQLTSTPADETMPAVSPDGQRLVFISNRAGADSIFMMPIAGNASEVVDISAEMGATPTRPSRPTQPELRFDMPPTRRNPLQPPASFCSNRRLVSRKSSLTAVNSKPARILTRWWSLIARYGFLTIL